MRLGEVIAEDGELAFQHLQPFGLKRGQRVVDFCFDGAADGEMALRTVGAVEVGAQGVQLRFR